MRKLRAAVVKSVAQGKHRVGLAAWECDCPGKFVGLVGLGLRDIQIGLANYTRPMYLQNWQCRERVQYRQDGAHL